VKKNVRPFDRGLAEIERLEVVNYQYNGLGLTTEDGNTYQGVTAQATKDIFPEMVKPFTRKIKLRREDEDYTPDYMMVDSTPLFWALVNAVKELSKRIAVLEGR